MPRKHVTATDIHRITWYVWAGSEKIRRTAKMRGTWGYDATCSCGWESRTGGALRRYVEDLIWMHKKFPDL